MKLQKILWAVALLAIAAAIPYAIIDTVETGRVYLFSSQFPADVAQRFTAPGRFRFVLQPTLAAGRDGDPYGN